MTLATCESRAAEVRTFEQDGITYQETTEIVPRQISDTRLEPREYTVYREKVTTDLKQVERAYQVPITEYKWVPYWERSFFRPPVLTYRLEQQTRMETRTESVRIPVTNRQYVAEKVTQQVPVVSNRTVNDTYIRRVAIATKPASPTGPAAPASTVPQTGDPFASSATARRDAPAVLQPASVQPESAPPASEANDGWLRSDPTRR